VMFLPPCPAALGEELAELAGFFAAIARDATAEWPGEGNE